MEGIVSFFLMFIFETEGDRAQVGEGKTEREIQNLKQAPGSEPETDAGLEPTNREIMT